MSLWDGLMDAREDIRHKFEESVYGREVTGDVDWQSVAESGKWDALSTEKGIIQPEAPQPENEMER